jgi:hypothetical protein
MKLKTLVCTLALFCAGATLSLAQAPQMGTWKLNEAKSKIPAGSVKNTTVTYEMQGDEIKVTTDGTGTDGAATHTTWTGKFDGKDYPLTGDATADTRAYTMVSDHVLSMTNKKAGKSSATARINVSDDGKTRTLHLQSSDSSGKPLKSTAMYDKQ